MKDIEIEFTSRAVSLPNPLKNIEGIKETVRISQGEVSGDNETDQNTALALCGGDLHRLIAAANVAAVSRARATWNQQNKTNVESGSAVEMIRLQVAGLVATGAPEKKAVRFILDNEHVYAACLLDGIDPSPALTEEQITKLEENLEEVTAEVVAKRESLAVEKAKREASGVKRGRPKKVSE